MRVFITGDMGKLGGRIARLLEADHEVIGFDIRRDKRQDICDVDALLRAMGDCQAVIHCAAIPHPNKGGFGRYFEINVQGSWNVFRAADRLGVWRVIMLSSTGFYGCDTQGRWMPAYLPIDERHPIASTPGRSLGALAAYNQSKVMAEQALAWYGTNRRYEAIVLRCAPANPKSWQYQGGFAWQEYCADYQRHGDNWKRGCLFANCHPDYIAQAAQKALDVRGQFWYEPFNIVDRYAPAMLDVPAFVEAEFPGIDFHWDESPQESLISPRKAMDVLGFEPCLDR